MARDSVRIVSWPRASTTLALLVAAFATTACDGDPPVAPDSGPADGGDTRPDAGADGGPIVVDAGTDAGPELAPVFRNAVELSDEELATQALRLMGAPAAGGEGSCNSCHTVTRQSVRRFWDLTDTAWRTCFTDLQVETQAAAQAIVDCFEDAEGAFSTANLGVFATGADFEWFRFVFRRAYGDAWEPEYDRFRMRVLQPPEGHTTFTQEEFDLLTEWFLRGTPWIERALPVTDATGECTSYVDASVVQLVADGEATGWSARNREAAILMHDCAGAASPLECLASYPLATELPFGSRWGVEGTQQRMLFTVPYRTSYWTKTSADGRFVGHGGNGDGAGASIIDLQRSAVVGVTAQYDPGFFPDNSGFMFQGSNARFCTNDVLTTGEPTLIQFNEPGCTGSSGIQLYQHVGAALDGGDYWVATMPYWTNDDGGSTADPSVDARRVGEISLHRFVNTGAGFTPSGTSAVSAPWQGNAVISPSMRVLVTQLATATGRPLGYVLRRLDVSRRADGSVLGVEAPEVARYCTRGGKAAMSLDDRWIVTHHRAVRRTASSALADVDAIDLGFTGSDDPGYTAYEGISNVYLIDVVTGERRRVTNMQPGQRALFPSFRSDGWLYYLVRAGAAGSVPEYVVASDAAIVWR